MRVRFRFVLLLSTVTAGSEPQLAADTPRAEPQAEFATAIDKLKAWRRSFATLRVRYRWANPNQLIARIPELRDNQEKLDATFHEVEWIWTDRQLAKQSVKVFEAGTLKRQEINGLNQRMSFSAIYDGENRFPKELAAAPHGPGHKWQFHPCVPLHFVFWPTNTWLPDAIDRNSPIATELRTLHGSRCVGFRMNSDSPDLIWLDLENEGLVRQTEPKQGIKWDCASFRKTPLGHAFPHTGTYQLSTDAADAFWFEVIDVGMNEPIPASTFDPPAFDESTAVTDRTGKLLKRKPAASPAIEPEALHLVPEPPNPQLRANPQNRGWIWQSALCISVICLLASVLLRQRSR